MRDMTRFWNRLTAERLFLLETFVDMYYRSVGHGQVMSTSAEHVQLMICWATASFRTRSCSKRRSSCLSATTNVKSLMASVILSATRPSNPLAISAVRRSSAVALSDAASLRLPHSIKAAFAQFLADA